MGDATANGDMPHSATLEHFSKYPLVHDSIDVIKNNQYGQKSIDLTNAVYSKLVKPTFPYLETPASYAKPYVIKADQLGDAFLTKVDEKVPVVKSETKELKGTLFAYIHWPLEKAEETKTYVLATYNDEYKKCGGDGLVAGGKAIITSSLVLTSVTLNWLSSILAQAKEEGKEAATEAQEKVEEKTSS